MLVSILLVAAGLGLLTKGADEFVLGAARLAQLLRIPAVVVGAVIVGFGTSAPEMLVSGLAAAEGDRDLGIGNVIGSNIANLSLVMGVAALVTPLVVTRSTMRREAPMAVVATLLFAVVVQGGISRGEGLILLTVLVVALVVLVATARGARATLDDAETLLHVEETRHLDGKREAVRTLLGIGATVAGAQLLVTGAIDIADELGVTTGFVGLTMVAVGTSLPELVTAVVASRNGHQDLVIGNVLGSNMFNGLAVAGVTAMVSPGELSDSNLPGLATWIMLAVVVVSWLFMRTRRVVARWEAAILLVVYFGTVPLLISDEEDEASASRAAVAVVEPAAPALAPDY